MENSEIANWYSNRSVLITGGGGFMGKILLEKLIRTCPNIHRIYVLLRGKRNLTYSQRLHAMFQLPVFEKIRKTSPKLFEKIVPLDGDIEKEKLGLNENDINVLQHELSVVFHGAASLRLEAGLRAAINSNCVATLHIIEFCKKLPKLEVFLHLSTAFCHCEHEILEERIYEERYHYENIFTLLKLFDDKTLQLLTPTILGRHPNCYTFSKRLAESIVDKNSTHIPTVILRPSIVIPALHEPIPGWVDSLNGPIGVLVASGKGVIRSMLVDGSNKAEVIPVDVAINGMIVGAWHRATHKFDSSPVYNMTSGDILQITWGEVLEKGKAIIRDVPFGWPVIWYPDGNIRTNRVIHSIIVFLFHILPAYFIDFLMLIFMQKRFMVYIQKRISVGLEVLQYFTLNKWNFCNQKFLSIANDMSDYDKKIFYLGNVSFDVDEYLRAAIVGARKYCIKDTSSIKNAKMLHRFLYILDKAVKCFIMYKIIYFVISCLDAADYFNMEHWKLVQ